MVDFHVYVSLPECKSSLTIPKQALKQKKADSDSSAASDTSDEETTKRRKQQLLSRERTYPPSTGLVATRWAPSRSL